MVDGASRVWPWVRQPVFIVTSLIFGLLTFLSVTINNIQIGSSDAVHVNSPFAVLQTITILSLFGMFIPVAILANVERRGCRRLFP